MVVRMPDYGAVRQMEKKRGFFIVLEGLDGSGKSMQARFLSEWLKAERGIDAIYTCEPTETSSVAEEIGRVLSREKSLPPLNFQKLFVEDRREHLEKLILPSLSEGKTAISDRYYYSTFAYGSSSVPLASLMAMNSGFMVPDLAIYVDVNPRVCMERIIKRSESDKSKTLEFFEKEEKLRKIAENYEKLFQLCPELKKIDGHGTPEEVSALIVKTVKSILK